MSKRLAISTMCAAAALLAGCHRGAPDGQVAATVNGEEVTLQELNTEIQASNIPQGMDKQVAQQQALQHIIDRKLLLDAARLMTWQAAVMKDRGARQEDRQEPRIPGAEAARR